MGRYQRTHGEAMKIAVGQDNIMSSSISPTEANMRREAFSGAMEPNTYEPIVT